MEEMRLIDANFVASEKIASYYENPQTEDEKIYNLALTIAKKLIRKAPTIEAEPIRHGRWVLNSDENFVCNQCRHPQQIGAKDFCGKCGARMDESTEGVQ